MLSYDNNKWRSKIMAQFDNKMIQEAAYYIWKNNGCPANSSAHDWSAAIEQLERQDALNVARAVSNQYSRCTFLPDIKLRINDAQAKQLPITLAKAFSLTKIASATVKAPAKKAVAKKATAAKKASAKKTKK